MFVIRSLGIFADLRDIEKTRVATHNGVPVRIGDVAHVSEGYAPRQGVVTRGENEESISALRRIAPPDISVVMSTQAWTDYEVPGSPYFVLVDGAAGRVEGEGTGATWPQVRNLIVQAGGDAADARFGRSGAAREARIDRELLAHGIRPGDPLLYHDGPDT